MRIRTRLLLALTLLSLSMTAIAAAGMVTVTQQGRAFGVGSLQISRGGVVRFSNQDKFIHQTYVEASTFTFESDEQEPGSNVDIEFSKAGTFEVRCHIHPKMLLHVDVR